MLLPNVHSAQTNLVLCKDGHFCTEKRKVHPHLMLMFVCNGTLNLECTFSAFNMDSSTDPSKPRSDMHLRLAELKDAYLKFTQMTDVSNIVCRYMQPRATQT